MSMQEPLHDESRRSPAPEASGAERRRERRLPKPPLSVSGVPAVVSDVSMGGACLTLTSPVPPGELRTLLLTDGLMHSSQELTAEVQWQHGRQVGLRWVRLDWQQERWLRECIELWERDGAPRAVSITWL